jgi:hypothetical protein
MTELATSRERIRDVLERFFALGTQPPSDRDIPDLAAVIDTALFGAEPGEWVGPQLPAEVIAKIRAAYAEDCRRPYDGCLHTRCVIAALLDDRTAQEATIRNQNGENVRLRDRLEEAYVTIRAFAADA